MERDITELFLEIAEECQFNPEEDGLEHWFQKCRRWLGLEEEHKIETDGKESIEESDEEDSGVKDIPESLQNTNSPFYIRDSGQILKIEREEELEEYKRKIKNLGNLEQLIKNYPEERFIEDNFVSAFEQVKKMVQELRDKTILQYEEDEDNTSRIVDYVKEKILEKHIKKIIMNLFRIVNKSGLHNQIRELLEAINQYLKQLGVYTVVVQVGVHYDGVINFYKILYDGEKGSNSDPIITEVDCPAYIVKYKDEIGQVWFVWSHGSCIGK